MGAGCAGTSGRPARTDTDDSDVHRGIDVAVMAHGLRDAMSPCRSSASVPPSMHNQALRAPEISRASPACLQRVEPAPAAHHDSWLGRTSQGQ